MTMWNRQTAVAAIGILTILVVMVANLGPGVPSKRGSAQANLPGYSPSQLPVNAALQPIPALPGSPATIQSSLREIVSFVRPSVVKIWAPPTVPTWSNQRGMQFLDPYATGSAKVGSGVIIHPQGYIVTSQQVVGNADTVKVTLYHNAQQTYIARRVASDSDSDLVLLRLPFNGNLPFAQLGDSQQVHTGDLVIALGSPFGLGESVSQGIVSTTGRSITVGGRRFNNLIQTDAAINQGNAGGPLVDIQGRVIGINIAFYSPSPTYSGIGFATESNRVRDFFFRVVGRRL